MKSTFYRLLPTLLLSVAPLRSLAQEPPPIPDTPFDQDYHEAYPLKTAAENDVRALALDGAQRLWAATAAGVRYLENGVWKTPMGGAEIGQTYAVYRDSANVIWVGAWNGLYRATLERVESAGLRNAPVVAIKGLLDPNGKSETLFVAASPGIFRSKSGGGWEPIAGSWHRAIRDIQPVPGGQLWIATASGLYLQPLYASLKPQGRLGKPNTLLSSNVHGLERLADGTLAIASTGGVDFYQGYKRTRSLSTKQGMPKRDSRAVAQDAEGRLWIATKLGVARVANGKWSLRHSRRWVQSDDTRDVVLGADGTAWVATAAGVDAIRRKKMTLAEKADYYLSVIRARHIRPPGLVGPAVLVAPGDLSRSFIEDDDNDGEHTGMHLAIESMRYAVTKDPAAQANAKAAFHAMRVLQEATGTRHFIARSVLPIGTAPRHEVDRAYTPEEIAEIKRSNPREKIIEKRWIPTADGKWLWKRDASSDEVDGHLFGYAAYFDLAADAEEKRLVADLVDRLVGGIVDNGYVLQDIDGKATQWGNWSPESLNGDPTWIEERAGNSVEMITHLGVAYHMTKKPRYQEAAKFLIEKHGYAQNMLRTVFDTPSERTHIEDELLSLVYPNLMTYLIFPELKTIGQTSIQRWHKAVLRDNIPFYDFVYNRFSGKRVPLEASVEVLRDYPLDHIEWTVDNSQREDVQFDLTPGVDEGRLTRILPRSEMGLCMWDQEPYRAVIGRGGDREDRPSDWLLAYWMGRYYGLLAAPAAR